MSLLHAFTDFPLATLVAIELVCLAAYFLKGMAGFGPAIVFIPSMSLLFGPRSALAASALIDLFVGLAMVLTLPYAKGDGRLVGRMLALMSAGTVVGAALAGFVPERVILAAMVAVVALLAVGFLLFDRPLPPFVAGERLLSLPLACVLGGVTGGFVGISGPLVVAAARPTMDKGRFRRVMAALFFGEGILKLAVYGAVGLLEPAVVDLATVAAPAVALGLLIGYRTHLAVSERAMNVAIGLVLLAISLRVGWGLATG